MKRAHLVGGLALVVVTAGAASASTGSVLGVQGHTTYAQIIIDGPFGGGDEDTIGGLITCPQGGWLDRIKRHLQGVPTCAASGYVYAFPAWAGEPWAAPDLEVVRSALQVDDDGQLWNTLALRYTPAALAGHVDGADMVEAFAVELVPPADDRGADASNYKLTIDAESLAVHADGIAALTLGVGPAPVA